MICDCNFGKDKNILNKLYLDIKYKSHCIFKIASIQQTKNTCLSRTTDNYLTSDFITLLIQNPFTCCGEILLPIKTYWFSFKRIIKKSAKHRTYFITHEIESWLLLKKKNLIKE